MLHHFGSTPSGRAVGSILRRTATDLKLLSHFRSLHCRHLKVAMHAAEEEEEEEENNRTTSTTTFTLLLVS
jgi:hypothetical protein